ncbi:iron ABC transporter permease [Candidatus Endowatersipora endosymbiont of Watersipora subatra]|uniref:ABC transporter permease n=1 Tax=Candidatus Endowatersipora endosymbiont of Watersipora subatra TaxID=3077946 RepID=UPI00312CA3ED
MRTMISLWKSYSLLSSFLVSFILVVVTIPFATFIFFASKGSEDTWPHLLKYVIPQATIQTMLLLIFVAIGTGFIGTGTAWLVTLCQFPGRKYFQWILILPIAVPSYIAAYSMVEILDYSGPVQSFIRTIGGYSRSQDYWFPDIRSLFGAGLMLSFILYPYVYMACRIVFSMQGSSALDACRSLGAGSIRAFFQIGLPMARPAIASGVTLAMMETLNDIGAVELLGVKTLTYAVFETWFNRDSLSGAMQLTILILIIIAVLISVERTARSKRSYTPNQNERHPGQIQMSPLKQMISVVACLFPIFIGLGIPIYVLIQYAGHRLDGFWEIELYSAAWNSFWIASLTAFLTTLMAYIFLLSYRLTSKPGIFFARKIAELGYTFPGTILAIGLLVPFAAFDNYLDHIMQIRFGISSGLIISGSGILIIYACSLRFFAIACGTLESGFSRISLNIDMTARTLGSTPIQLGFQIHTPIMARALGVASFLVFVDTMKDLSSTLLLRPFNFQTLSTLVYERSSQGVPEEAAIAALMIVFIGLIPVILLSDIDSIKRSV